VHGRSGDAMPPALYLPVALNVTSAKWALLETHVAFRNLYVDHSHVSGRAPRGETTPGANKRPASADMLRAAFQNDLALGWQQELGPRFEQLKITTAHHSQRTPVRMPHTCLLADEDDDGGALRRLCPSLRNVCACDRCKVTQQPASAAAPPAAGSVAAATTTAAATAEATVAAMAEATVAAMEATATATTTVAAAVAEATATTTTTVAAMALLGCRCIGSQCKLALHDDMQPRPQRARRTRQNVTSAALPDVCWFCHKPFQVTGSKGLGRYCNIECFDAALVTEQALMPEQYDTAYVNACVMEDCNTLFPRNAPCGLKCPSCFSKPRLIRPPTDTTGASAVTLTPAAEAALQTAPAVGAATALSLRCACYPAACSYAGEDSMKCRPREERVHRKKSPNHLPDLCWFCHEPVVKGGHGCFCSVRCFQQATAHVDARHEVTSEEQRELYVANCMECKSLAALKTQAGKLCYKCDQTKRQQAKRQRAAPAGGSHS
jgi:hypothetical protein